MGPRQRSGSSHSALRIWRKTCIPRIVAPVAQPVSSLSTNITDAMGRRCIIIIVNRRHCMKPCCTAAQAQVQSSTGWKSVLDLLGSPGITVSRSGTTLLATAPRASSCWGASANAGNHVGLGASQPHRCRPILSVDPHLKHRRLHHAYYFSGCAFRIEGGRSVDRSRLSM